MRDQKKERESYVTHSNTYAHTSHICGMCVCVHTWGHARIRLQTIDIVRFFSSSFLSIYKCTHIAHWANSNSTTCNTCTTTCIASFYIYRHVVRTDITHTNGMSACTYHLTYLLCVCMQAHTHAHTHTDISVLYHQLIKTYTYRPPDIIEYKTNWLNIHRDYVTKLVYGWQL